MKIIKAFIGKIKAIDEVARTLTITASTGSPDRVGESIPAKNWKLENYAKNPVILWAHDYSAQPVGKALWSKVEGDGLIQKIQFATTAFASDIFSLYKDGFLNAFSVGFSADRSKDNPNVFENCELLEVSCVPVPCNAEALAQRMIKGAKFSPQIETIVKDIIKAAKENKAATETETAVNYEMAPVADFDPASMKGAEIDAEKGISAKIGAMMDGGEMAVQMFSFLKSKDWTIETATAWVAENGDNEFDCLKPAETDDGKAIAELIEQKNSLLAELGRYKAGRVLSGKNRELIGTCIDAMSAALKDLGKLYDATDPNIQQDDAPVPAVKIDATLDKKKKASIIYNNKTPTGISAKDVSGIVAAGLKAADIPGTLRREINRLKGIVE